MEEDISTARRMEEDISTVTSVTSALLLEGPSERKLCLPRWLDDDGGGDGGGDCDGDCDCDCDCDCDGDGDGDGDTQQQL